MAASGKKPGMQRTRSGARAKGRKKRTSTKSIPPLGSTAQRLRDRIVELVRDIDRNEAEVVTEVRQTIAQSLRAGGAFVGDAGSAIEEVVRGSVAATSESGASMLVTIKAVAKGVILGVADVGGDVVAAALAITRNAVEAAAALGADTQSVAWRAVSGIVEAGREAGYNAATLVASAVRGALEAAREIGTQALTVFEQSFVSVSAGLNELFKAEPVDAKRPPAKTQASSRAAAKKKTTARSGQKGTAKQSARPPAKKSAKPARKSPTRKVPAAKRRSSPAKRVRATASHVRGGTAKKKASSKKAAV